MFTEYRIKRKLTQEQLSSLTNLDTRTIQKIENGERTPSVESLSKIVKALEIEDEDIIKYIKDYTKNTYLWIDMYFLYEIVGIHYFKNNIKDIIKNIIPKANVSLVITNSRPLSFWCPNSTSLPPDIILPASLALLPCNSTIAIINTDTISNIFSNIFSHPFQI